MTPYKLSAESIRRFMAYHNINRMKDVAEKMCISAPYLTQLMSGVRPLNESIRLRFQAVTKLTQDQLFIPNYEAEYAFQQFNWSKYNGVMKYDESSIAENARYGPDDQRKRV